MRKKANLKLIRQYACLAIEEMARPLDFKSCEVGAQNIGKIPSTFIRNDSGNYSKVYQMLNDWGLMQFE